MKFSLIKLIPLLVLFYGCQKPKPVTYSGQLLLTKHNPIPLSNRKINIYQTGGNAIIAGASGSSASAVTDANGRFSITFIPGESYFAGFSGTNKSPLDFSSEDEAFPSFFRKNFPDSNYNSATPTFIGKTVDMVIIKVGCIKNIIPSDTIALQGSTLQASFFKKYTGMALDSGAVFTLDTIYNVLYTYFDGTKNMFGNDIRFGKMIDTPAGHFFYGIASYPPSMSTEDETKQEISFNYY